MNKTVKWIMGITCLLFISVMFVVVDTIMGKTMPPTYYINGHFFGPVVLTSIWLFAVGAIMYLPKLLVMQNQKFTTTGKILIAAGFTVLGGSFPLWIIIHLI